ncbi:cobalt ECF transporter T component CbiQ [Lignipirellula cremea]|uniref:Cobalt import ATP-binding protein CbiO n=1 Tax=Lignipirellula cremea TaxID=2528010 RepID=A0A518E516_9BACT|nr:cobalt ECF transporter T component CbiQ [Lignipirellula cremea]QDU99174.1 Cobalt import ATP-binding protein CbiO [Lignipirellula cremea]
MHADYLDRYSRRESVVHRLDARVKIVAALVLVVAVSCLPGSWRWAYPAAAAVVFTLYALTGLPWSYLFKRLAWSLPFLAMVAAGAPLSRGLSDGFDLAICIVLRALLSLVVMVTLVSTTPFSKLLFALQQLGAPRIIIWILAFMYRYMFVLADELARMRRAKLARSFRTNWMSEVRLLGSFVGVLFVRSFERAERVHAAMCARGWQGELMQDEEPQAEIAHARINYPDQSPMTPPDDLEVRNLTFHYPDGVMALEQVSFAIEAGETVGVVGPNGAGKSTLLLHLNGILPGRPEYEHHHFQGAGKAHRHGQEPQVWIAGIPVGQTHDAEIRRRVGLLFQDPDDQLFCPTVLEDVTFGPRNLGLSPEEAAAVARKCLREVGLTDCEERLPHHLSFGQRKRVCLAAVLACQPAVLALDEPTSNLDAAARRQFLDLLHALPLTQVIATHDLELVVELCDRVILLDQGRVHALGPTREILSNEPLLIRHRLEMPLSLRYESPRGIL